MILNLTRKYTTQIPCLLLNSQFGICWGKVKRNKYETNEKNRCIAIDWDGYDRLIICPGLGGIV